MNLSLLRLTDCRKAYGAGNFELFPLTFDIQKGDIIGIVGENGNGKTTLLRLIAGDLSLTSGSMQYKNEPLVATDWNNFKNKIAYMPQRIPKWHGYLKTNLILEARYHKIPEHEINNYIDELLASLGLTKYSHLKWSEISTGYRLRFQLAKIMIRKPEILVLDEPIGNLDIKAQQRFLTDLCNWAKDNQTAVIFSSQHLHEIENYANKIIYLNNGKLKYEGQLDAIGDTQSTNLFELIVNIDQAALTNIIGDSIKMEQSGKTIILTVHKSTTASIVLQKLLDADVNIQYFRDITYSAKSLFQA